MLQAWTEEFVFSSLALYEAHGRRVRHVFDDALHPRSLFRLLYPCEGRSAGGVPFSAISLSYKVISLASVADCRRQSLLANGGYSSAAQGTDGNSGKREHSRAKGTVPD